MSHYRLVLFSSFFVCLVAQPPPHLINPMHDPSISVLSSLFGASGYGRRGQPLPAMMTSRLKTFSKLYFLILDRFPDYFDPISASIPQNRMMGMGKNNRKLYKIINRLL